MSFSKMIKSYIDFLIDKSDNTLEDTLKLMKLKNELNEKEEFMTTDKEE